MQSKWPIDVAIIGGGCASIAAAFELTRPVHQGRYRVSVYQMGWRIGGKGASGRGPANRIEEHGLHVWLGFYENAFRLLRECYDELGRDRKKCPIADWRDAFIPDSRLGMADRSRQGDWLSWTAFFPPGDGLPGDPTGTKHPFRLANYIMRAIGLLQTLLFAVETRKPADVRRGVAQADSAAPPALSAQTVLESIRSLLGLGLLTTSAALIEALAVLQTMLRIGPQLPEKIIFRFVDAIASAIRERFESLLQDDKFRYKWEVIDLIVAIIVGTFRFRLLTDPAGLDAINHFECREWLRLNGASERSLNCAFMRALYDLALAYENGDRSRPGLAAGQALRGSLRMFFSYRGAFFWKMRAGMGDVVFAPFYEVLVRRGVEFHFFHRLTNVGLAASAPGEGRFIGSLDFDVQAEIRGGVPYQPLIEVQGIPCWSSTADYAQLESGEKLKADGWEFESHWDRRYVRSKTLHVGKDFDFVVLGVSIGEIPNVCKELIATDEKWRAMVANVKTVATQAFQIWLREPLDEVGWTGGPATIAGFAPPFDTWADMTHVASAEGWQHPPKTIAYFCGVLPDRPGEDLPDATSYPALRRQEVQQNAVQFLEKQIHDLWPNAAGPAGGFRWDLLCDPAAEEREQGEEARFASQFWTANVNPTDRYVLALPDTLKYRISPLDFTYNNLTIAGDWTDCGFNEGCVEAAVMSGRLAAHAIAAFPPLEDIIGYDHP